MADLIKLEPIEYEDLPMLQAWRNDPEVRLICREYRLLSMEHQRDWYEKIILDTDFLMFKIKKIDSPISIGVCGWTFIDWRSRHALLSLYIGDSIWRSDDYYAAIFDALHSIAFLELNLHCVRAEVYDFDPRKSMFYNAGYKESGRRREQYYHDGRHFDIIIMDLLKSEWVAPDDKWHPQSTG